MHMEKLLQRAWEGLKIGWGGGLGIPRVKQAVYSRLMEIQLWLPVSPAAGEVPAGIMTPMPPQATRLGESHLRVPALMPDNPVSPHMCLSPCLIWLK